MRRILLTVLLMGLVAGSGYAQWTDDFESYAVNTWPGPWTGTANGSKITASYVDNTEFSSGSKSLRLYGTLNACYAAFASRALNILPPFEIEMKIRNNNEQLSGCHPERANIYLMKGSGYSGAGREILRFDGDGSIYSRASGLALGSYSALTWYSVKIKYERPSGTTVKLSYWINGTYMGSETLDAISAEDEISHFELGVQEGTAWFDDISISAATSSSDYLIDDGFENDALGSQPAGWILKYNGTGTSNQVVVGDPMKNGLHVFQMEGKSSWASEFYKVPDEMPVKVTLEAWVNCEKTLSGLAGSVGLGNFTVGTWGTRTSRLQFYAGKIQATYSDNAQGPVYNIQNYTPGEWYHIKMEHNLTARTYKVYINGVQVSGTNGSETLWEFPMHPTTETIHVMLAAGNSGTTKMFFDDVRLYDTGTGTGIDNRRIQPFRVYPNPTQGMICIGSVSGLDATGVTGVKLISLSGMVVKNLAPAPSFDISDVAPGTYFLVVTSANGKVFSQKIIKR